jgi:alkylation response protein AidB-like acyl-CoA dehydrogenase
MWAPFLPSEWGGLDMDMATLAAVHEEVGRGCSSVRSLLTVHAMVAWAVHRWGSPAQRAKWLARLAAGTALGSLCLTEPTGGSDATRLATMAVRDSSGWRLTGVKEWITGGQRADVFLVFARTERGIAAFLVPRDSPGVKITAIHDVLGTRASMLARVTLRQVAVDADAMVGPDGFAAGMVITGTLDLGRLSVAAGSVGILQACLDACARYTASRTVGTTRLRDLQLIRAKITDMVTDVHAGRQLCERAALLKDAGDPDALMATMIAKYFSSRAAARHASEAVQIHGANGCGPHYPVARYYRDAKIMEIIEGSSEIQQITIADDAYRGPAS